MGCKAEKVRCLGRFHHDGWNMLKADEIRLASSAWLLSVYDILEISGCCAYLGMLQNKFNGPADTASALYVRVSKTQPIS